MPAESVHLKWKSTVLESKTKGIAVNLTTMPIFKNLFITISTTLMLSFFDGVNERGFAAAVLYFEGYAHYDLSTNNKERIASLDFLHYLLGHCSSINDLTDLLKNTSIVGFADPVTKRAAPLHWIATDRSGKSVVIEQTITGLEIIENPIGVMTNSPDIRWHLTNLRNYLDLSTTQQDQVNWGNLSLKPFGQGAGTTNLPGSFTSPDRFVRASFLKTHTQIPNNNTEAIMTCFHIMNSVFIPKGIVLTNKGTDDYTKYVAFMHTNTSEYYFKAYENNQIISASLWDYDLDGTELISLGSIVYPFTI
ncbi:MAG TPA: linear amide C-N hydrolase [Bacilli bacterium]|nr:linear amide C-N hydrolase [Bacilli bacterium]